MDPNEALKNARALAAWLLESTRLADSTAEECEDKALELAQAFQALDGWLSQDGFLPHAWARCKAELDLSQRISDVFREARPVKRQQPKEGP